MQESTTCILGAGYSYAAGVPLAKDIFRQPYLLALSHRSQTRFDEVISHYYKWEKQHPDQHSEEFMGQLYAKRHKNDPRLWHWTVEYSCAVIASAGTPPASLNRNPRYSNRINRPSINRTHRSFWEVILNRFNDVSVVTTNYDILIEQALRHRPMKRPPSPGCFYGGIPRPQLLKGAAQPFSAWSPERIIEMTGSVPIYKLHGSLSWSLNGAAVILYQDLRPAFRHGGDSAIIPPIPDKDLPEWLEPVWKEAETTLRRCNIWIICGYSVPAYDVSVQKLLSRSSIGEIRTVLVLSPDAMNICGRLRELMPKSKFIPLSGLPRGIDELARELDPVRE
jgi:hypothetical protein